METKNEQTTRRILIVDDNEDIREIVYRSLKDTEFNVISASNGREGINLAKELKPDLILLDIMMPQFDGLLTCKVLKRNLATKDIPIIFLTAKKTKEDIAAALHAGGSDYIVKPFSPKDLLTRIRKFLSIYETQKTKKQGDKKTVDSSEAEIQPSQPAMVGIPRFKIKKYDNILVCTNIIPFITMNTWKIYQGLFSNIISDGIFKIVVDFNTVRNIDGSGLALLISINQAVQNYGGQLVLTYPSKEINGRFSFTKINDLFRCFNTVRDAVNSLKSENVPTSESFKDINLCLSCSFINEENARYCAFCGTNLIVGRGKNIIESLKRSISKKLIQEEQEKDDLPKKTQKDENLEHEIPSEFMVEVYDDNFMISYKSKRTFRNDFVKRKQIGIEFPSYKQKHVELQEGTAVWLKIAQSGANIIYKTKIERIDKIKNMFFVHYDEDAMAMHTQKNFTIAPSFPISIEFIAPSIEHTGEIITGKILEMSRVRLVVFAENPIEEHECLGVNFDLPDTTRIASPLVIAQKRKDRFMYDMEFVVIDEKERSKMIQYMYKRQIEMAKLESR